MSAYYIHAIRPEHYLHYRVFDEMTETLAAGFNALGIRADVVDTPKLTDRRYIIFGAVLAEREDLPPDCIIYNLEVLNDYTTRFFGEYLKTLQEHEVWDYSETNIARLASLGIAAKYLPVGYYPGLTRIPEAEKDIDVLFYGSANQRRSSLLMQFPYQGVKLTTLFGAYGENRDAKIARAKIVLNLHAYPDSPPGGGAPKLLDGE